jgi:hypothetical protein
MNCRELAELLIDYVSGELPAEQCDHIKNHLGECPPCVIFLETYQITIQWTRQLPPAPLPPELIERLKTAMAEMPKSNAD